MYRLAFKMPGRLIVATGSESIRACFASLSPTA